MDEEQEKQFKNECAAALELVQEIVVKHGIDDLTICVFQKNKGLVHDGFIEICDIGYSEPKNKARIK